MYNEDELIRIESIQKKLNSIFEIIKRHDGLVKALSDEVEAQPAILMLLIATAEQFNKLQNMNSILLNNFDNTDLKGISSIKNFIAHDYDGVQLAIIESTIRHKLPNILKIINNILNNGKN